MKRGMNRALAVCAIVGATTGLLAGCGEKPPEAAAVAAAPAPASAPPPPKPPYTKVQWREAFRSSFEERQKDSKSAGEDGITEYMACRNIRPDGTCALLAFGTRDAFRKLDHLTPVSTRLNKNIRPDSYIGIYIAALECEAPSIMIAPTINRRGGWLFIEKVALMADGELVLERDFSKGKVEREPSGRFVHEKATFIATAAERAALKAFVDAKSRAIRITGEKGYATVGKRDTEEFVMDAGAVLEFMQAMDDAFQANGGPVCDVVPDASATPAPTPAPAAAPRS